MNEYVPILTEKVYLRVSNPCTKCFILSPQGYNQSLGRNEGQDLFGIPPNILQPCLRRRRTGKRRKSSKSRGVDSSEMEVADGNWLYDRLF